MEADTSPFFSTANVQLASALALGGIPWLNDNEPVQVEYDEEYLHSNGCKTISEAREKRLPGRFAYYFKPVPELKECLKAFDAAKAEISDLNKRGQPVLFLEQLPPHVRVEIAAKAIAIGAMVKEVRFKAPPWITYRKEGEEQTVKNEDGSTTVTSPGYIRYRKDAPERLKEELHAKL